MGSLELKSSDPRLASSRSFQKPSAARGAGVEPPRARASLAPRCRCLSRPRASSAHRSVAASSLGDAPTPAAFRYEVVHLAAVHLAIDLLVLRGRHLLGPESCKPAGHFLLISDPSIENDCRGKFLASRVQGSRHAIPRTSSGRPIECQPHHPAGAPRCDHGRPPVAGADHHRP